MILQSGSSLSHLSFASEPLRYTNELSRKLNCSTHDSLLLVRCLKKFSYEILVGVPIVTERFSPAVGPVVDSRTITNAMLLGSSIATSPNSTSCPQDFGATPLLVGVRSNEGRRFFSQDEITEGMSDANVIRFLRTFVQNVFRFHEQKISDILAHNYYDWDNPKDKRMTVMGLSEMIGDGLYAAPIVDLAQRHFYCSKKTTTTTAAAQTFLYSFSLSSESNEGSLSSDDEMPYIFGAPLADGIQPFGSKYSPQEKRLSKSAITYWVNFIRTGYA